MINRTFTKSSILKKTIFGGALLCIALLATSCKNFMHADDTRKEIVSAIDYANAKSYLILVEAAKGSGTIVKPVGGEVTKKVTDSFNIVFEPAQDYHFVRWEAKSSKLPAGANIQDYIKIEEPGSLETSVTFIKELSDIVIYANCPRIPYADVWIDGSNGKLSPAKGTHTVNQNESNYISFEADGDYAFIKWQIFDNATGSEIQNGLYLEIENPSAPDTNFKLVNVPTDQAIQLALKPLVLERPQVISATPVYDSKGAYRDARIQVMFDRDIDPDSIYYTINEYKAIKDELKLEENDFLKIDLGTATHPDVKYYGYTKDNTTVFKNIQIVNNKTYANLLNHFEKPRFEGSRRLIIYPKKDNLPPGGTTYLITLDKNFSFLSEPDKKPVNMREAKKWIYFVNSETDQTPPSVSKVEIRDANDDPVSTDSSKYSYLNSEKKLKFRVAVTDFDSGPSPYFSMLLESTDPGVDLEKPIPIYYEEVEEGYASCGNVYNEDANNGTIPKTYYEYTLTELPEQDGKYKFSLKFYDNSVRDGVVYKNGTETMYYYICLDTTALSKDKISTNLSAVDGSSGKAKINFNYNATENDFSKVKLYYRRAVSVAASDSSWYDWKSATALAENSQNNTDIEIDNLDYGATYEIKADFYDNAKNLTTCYYKKSSIPVAYASSNFAEPLALEQARTIKVPVNMYPTGANQTILEYKEENDTDFTQIVCDNNQNKTFYIRNMKYAASYEIKATAQQIETIEIDERYENKGQTYTNTSSGTIHLNNLMTKPQGVNTLSYALGSQSNNEGNKVTFTLTGDFTGVQYAYTKYNKNGILDDNTTQMSTTESRTFTITLDYNSRYKFKFKSYHINSSNTCSDEAVKEIEVITGKNTQEPENVNSSSLTIETTMNTARLRWTKPEGDIGYYIISEDKINSIMVPGTETSCLITGLSPNTEYHFKIVSYSSNDEQCAYEDQCLKYATTQPDDNHFSIHTCGYSDITLKLENRVSSNPVLKMGETYNNLDDTKDTTTRYGYIEIDKYKNAALSSDKTYYFQYYLNDQPITEIFASKLAIEATISHTSFLQKYTYIPSDNSLSLKLYWNECNYEVTSIRYKAVNSTTWEEKSVRFTTSNDDDEPDEITIDNLDSDTAYDIRIWSSNKVLAAAFASTVAQPETIISNLECENVTEHSAKLSWDAVSDCDYYNIYRVFDDKAPVIFADKIETPYITLNNLATSNIYKLTVVPQKSNTKCAVSNNEYIEVTTQPERFNLLRINSTTTNSCVLDIDSFFENTRPYIKIYWKLHSADSWSSSKLSWEELPNSVTYGYDKSYTITSLLPMAYYDVKVVKVSNDVESDPITRSFYTLPVKPTSINASQITSDSITVNWSLSSGQFSKALLLYKKTNDTWTYEVPLKIFDYSDSKSYTVNDLEPNTQYTFYLYCYSDEYMTDTNKSEAAVLSVSTTQ